MSFGRWLLVHSFTLLLLILILAGYFFRTELKLEMAYQQLLNLNPEPITEIEKEESAETVVEVETQASTVDNNIQTKKPEIEIKEEKTPSASTTTLPRVSTVTTTPEKKVDPAEISKTDNRLFQARQAYWDKNYADAIYLYRQLIQENGFNPDYLGELGNIYYSLNDTQNASQLYYQAALQFIELKETDRARSLVAPIIAMNRDLGEKLKRKLK